MMFLSASVWILKLLVYVCVCLCVLVLIKILVYSVLKKRSYWSFRWMTSWSTSVCRGTLTIVLHVVYAVQTYCVYGFHKLVWGCRGTVYVVQGTAVWGLELLGTSVSWGCGSLKSSNKQPSSHGSYRERVLSRYYSPSNHIYEIHLFIAKLF